MKYEVGMGFNKLDIDWIGNPNFSPSMIVLEGMIWLDYSIGLRFQYGIGQSEKADGVDYKRYSARMKEFTSTQLILKRYFTDKIGVEMGFGMMNYDQAVTHFNNVDYTNTGDNYSNSDSGFSWSLGLSYKIDENMKIRGDYNFYHAKTKWEDIERDGTEKTKWYSLTVVHSF